MHEGSAYVVTRPQGRSLQEVVEGGGPLPELEAIELVRALADALVYLHQEGLVYQVLSPGSAVLAADARSAQLAFPLFCVPIGSSVDPFGVGLPVRSETNIGRFRIEERLGGDGRVVSFHIAVPRFAAPESLARPSRAEAASASDHSIQPTVDVYGLGETLFYLLAGRPAFSDTPFVTTLLLEKMRGPADVRAIVPTITAPTARLVADLTAPYTIDRPATAAAVLAELDRIAARLRG
jgi:serine/threonine protein kinase